MTRTRAIWLANAVLAAAVTLYSATPISEITLPGKNLFPESITSLKDGTLIVGTVGPGSILRIKPGSTTAEEWIKPRTGGLATVLGVLADEKSNTLWVCSNNLDGQGTPSALRTFDLKTGAPKGAYPLPGNNPFCNDIAIHANGSAYVADTVLNSVLVLRKGAASLEIAAQDEKLAGADGLAFGARDTLYVNSVTTGKLLRLDLGKDGKASSVVEMTVSRPLDRPDGMRTLDASRLLLAENAGRMSILRVSGNAASVTYIKEGLESTPAVTATRGQAWIVEGKLNYRNDPQLKGKDPGLFKMYAVPLPKP